MRVPARRLRPVGSALVLLLVAALPASAQDARPDPKAPAPLSKDPVARGAYVFHAAGCGGCHTAEGEGAVPLAGRRALKHPSGTTTEKAQGGKKAGQKSKF